MTEALIEVKRDKAAQKKHDYRNRKHQNNNDELQQAKLNAECHWKAKSR